MIAQDMENDAKYYEGKPFNGRNVAEYFGKQGAAIAALANIMREDMEKEKNLKIQTREETADNKVQTNLTG